MTFAATPAFAYDTSTTPVSVYKAAKAPAPIRADERAPLAARTKGKAAASARAVVKAPVPARAAEKAAKVRVKNPRPSPRHTEDVARLVRPEGLGTGGLLLDTKRKGRYLPAPRLSTTVRIDVTGPIARTRFTQSFSNPSGGWVEGLYVFPLPEGAAVDDLDMRIGNRHIAGHIVSRDKLPARLAKSARYRSLVRIGHGRKRMFISRVANIGPGEMVTVRFDYQQNLEPADGAFSLRLPLKTARAAGRAATGAAKTDRVSLTVDLRAGFALGTVKSHNHEVATEPKSASHVVLSMNRSLAASRDFVLTWEPAPSARATAQVFRERIGDADYLLATIMPPSRDSVTKAPPRELILVVDTSASMAGLSLAKAKPALGRALAGLRETDRFNVIGFNGKTDPLFAAPVPATKDNIGRADAFLAGLKAKGGTDMLPALEAALDDKAPKDDASLRQVVFVTDGAIARAPAIFSLIRNLGGRTRLYPVAIGAGPDRLIMQRMAQLGRGDVATVRLRKDIGTGLDTLFKRLEMPTATGLTADWSAVRIQGSPVDPLPDLFGRQPISVVARVDSLTGHLVLRGETGGAPWVEMLDLSKAGDGVGIGKLYAGRLIDRLEAERRAEPRRAAKIDRDIARLALAHGLVSRKTRLVAEETVEPPAAVGLSGSAPPFGLTGRAEAKSAAPITRIAAAGSADRPTTLAMLNVTSAPVTDAAAGPIAGVAGKLVLPVTATPAQKRIEAGLLMVIFGLVLAGVTLMWYQFGRELKRERTSRWEDWT